MRTLVIETATKACSVALYDGTRVIAASHEVIGRGHAERLLPAIAAMPGQGRCDRVLVDIGPGSFTGIRVGVAAARALGLAWGVPVHGFNGLSLVAAMARQQLGDNRPVDVVMTGGHGEYFHQHFDNDGAALLGPASVSPDALQSALGSATMAGDTALEFDETTHIELLPDASRWHLISELPFLPPSPAYGRAPDAKLPKARTA